jgi:hypothetical protein
MINLVLIIGTGPVGMMMLTFLLPVIEGYILEQLGQLGVGVDASPERG